MIGTQAIHKIEQEEGKLVELARKLWEHPETAYNEVKACAWFSEALRTRSAGYRLAGRCPRYEGRV